MTPVLSSCWRRSGLQRHKRGGLLGLRPRPSGRRRFAPALSRCCAPRVEPNCLFLRGFKPHIFIDHKKRGPTDPFFYDWRREGDSNPRRVINPYTLSKRAHSTALPPLLKTLSDQVVGNRSSSSRFCGGGGVACSTSPWKNSGGASMQSPLRSVVCN